jgi:hypothetical protein
MFLRRKLMFVRFFNIPDEEDGILDEMDSVWWKLSVEERILVDNEKHCEIQKRKENDKTVDVDIHNNIGFPIRTK